MIGVFLGNVRSLLQSTTTPNVWALGKLALKEQAVYLDE